MQHMVLRLRFTWIILALAVFLLFVGFMSAFVVAQPSYAAAPHLSIQFTCAQAVDYQSGQVCVHTQAKAALTIRVKYCSGAYATSSSLKGTQNADSRGNHTWNWTPQTKCKGIATAFVTDMLNGDTLNTSKNFSVK